MANFEPLKRSLLYSLQQLVARHDLRPEFLDIGCGIGDVSAFLAKQGWTGTAIDISDEVLEQARLNLGHFPGVRLRREDLFAAGGSYRTVLMIDILEHLPDDAAALRKLATLVEAGGHAVIVVPSNPRKWGWDDDFYGHIHRYAQKDLEAKLRDSGLEPVEIWDFTFPVFTAMRAIHTRVVGPPAHGRREKTMSERTLKSGMAPEWQRSSLVDRLSRARLLWKLVYRVQFAYFRKRVKWGHEMIVLAKNGA
jgi:SAM-dependent methyltransferase